MKDDEREVLERAFEHATRFIGSVDERPVLPSLGVDELRARLGKPLTYDGLPAARVVDELAADADGGLMSTGGGRFFGWAIGGMLPASLGADWLTSAWDQNSVIYATSPAFSIIEEVAGEWLKDLLRLPPHASFAFVTGCQAAHVTALASARQKLLSDRGYDVGARGLTGAPRIKIHTGELFHESILRAARLLGLGTEAVESHPCGLDGKLDLDALERKLDGTDDPFVLVLQAGEFNTGAFDDFHKAAALARAHDAWVHVDGALGLFAAASDTYRHLMDGCELADSWATDGHKWLNLPFDSGFVFTAHPEAHKEAMTIRASYFSAEDDVRQQIDWGPEWSRRGRGVPVYAALRSLGRKGLENLVDRCCEHARAIVEGIEAMDGTEVMCRPVINQGVVRFLAQDGDHDRRTDAVVERLQESGVTWFGAATWKGYRVMRVPVLSWRTGPDDVERTLAAVKQAMEEVGG